MFQDKPAWIAHQRKRYLRPDWERYMRPDWRKWLTPESAPWLPPEAWQTKKPPPGVDADALDVMAHRQAIVRLRDELDKIAFELKYRRLMRKAGFNPDQPRVPAGQHEGGQWTSEGGGGGISGGEPSSQGDETVGEGGGASDAGTGDSEFPSEHIQLAGDLPPLRRIHPDSTYESDSEAKHALDFWRQRPTGEIVESLKPGTPAPLQVTPDGTVMNGNTRVKILEERGYNTNSLPRELHEIPSLEVGRPRGGGGGSSSGGGRVGGGGSSIGGGLGGGGGFPPRLLPPLH
jgi:hypothetical protein